MSSVEGEPEEWVTARAEASKSVSLRAGAVSLLLNAVAFAVVEQLYTHDIAAGERVGPDALAGLRHAIFTVPVVAIVVAIGARWATRNAIGLHEPGASVSDRIKAPKFWWRSLGLPVLVGLVPYLIWIVTILA
ncbi:MAG TPA: hypothetical protein VN108_02020 [Marmoricola sp.]|nr:hypothetical protein [Marmoricola sp.]